MIFIIVALYPRNQLFKGRNCRGGPPWPPLRDSGQGRPRRAAPTVVALAALILVGSQARASEPPVLSVLDFGSTSIAKQATETLRTKLRATGNITVADLDLSRAAAKG